MEFIYALYLIISIIWPIFFLMLFFSLSRDVNRISKYLSNLIVEYEEDDEEEPEKEEEELEEEPPPKKRDKKEEKEETKLEIEDLG